MSFPSAAFCDAMRMDTLEAKLDLILAARHTKYTAATPVPPKSPKNEKVGKGKCSAIPAAPATNAPNGPLLKKCKSSGKGSASSPGKPSLRIWPDDWVVPITEKKDLVPGVQGVNEVAEDEALDPWRMLEKTSENLVMISEKKFEEAGEHSKDLDCQYLDPDNRVLLKKRWYTNLGKGTVMPTHLGPINKIVLDLVKRHGGRKWTEALTNPGVAF